MGCQNRIGRETRSQSGVKEIEEGVTLPVKVIPKAKQEKIVGRKESWLKVKVASPPEKGAANRATIRLLAKTLKIPQKNIVLIKGSTYLRKQFCLSGITKDSAKIKTLIKILT